MRVYEFIQRVAAKIVRLDTAEYGTQLWTRGLSRKAARCEVCSETLPSGAETWRPVTFAGNRMDRIGNDCIATMERRHGSVVVDNNSRRV